MRTLLFAFIMALLPLIGGAQQWQLDHIEGDELLGIEAHGVLRIDLEQVRVSINLQDMFFTFDLKEGTFETSGNHLYQWAWAVIGIYSPDGQLLSRYERIPFVSSDNSKWCRTYQWSGKSKRVSKEMYKNLAAGGYVRIVFTKFGGYRCDITLPAISCDLLSDSLPLR